MNARVRVGLVGAGSWARRVHAPGLADHPDTVLSAVWTRRPEAAAALADEHGARACGSFAELLERVDAVALAVPPSVQPELAVAAAEAGKHLILEKPLATSVEQAQRVARAVSEAGVVALVLLTLRYARRTRDWLAELAETGGWTGGSARWLSGALLGDQYGRAAWRHEIGALGDIGPHVFDLMSAALGDITSVVAARCDDNGLWHVMVEHAGGATSTASLASRLPIMPTAIEFAVYGEHGLRVLGREPDSQAASYAALLDDFTAMIDSGVREHPCDVHRGVHLQRILAECHELAGR
ncbi:MAG: Gfo/Idh/MocA family protein [Saccharomonospora viridis]|uniref:Predicted dehydrogenase n=1 Tax=Saccharomonospora viridis (strain ATCC 15386 / DSM 43017 / JCM 3036 / CCUG 5913 / NBRC 12207 / NCIMB 9602 / P101) TaxID=471857 RepID=C7MRD8_SACVD|nr:Gfo/Idh/MocA family oxidoreductase [Saccharomonospora viridis]ACU98724.1 predicted dehydrogenase [Saccharomonospora viridis DSM 43017]SFP66401.1 Predicted dehydrogenase [Saccharomonospora viridis]